MKILITESQYKLLTENQKKPEGEEWGDRYNEAKTGMIDMRIRRILKKIFEDPEVRVRVGDNFHWTDGSNGFINFSNFNEYVTDIGYMTYADNPSLMNDIKAFKEHILYSYATSEKSDTKAGERYRDFKYTPKSFNW